MLTVDPQKSQGHGRGLLVNPDIFDVDDAGYRVVLHANPAPEFDADVETAIHSCPVQAISRT
jgi:ferredoxin